MILSESEKNRIKGLYGLVTEAETAPPPDESVLVDKKNPFNDRNFENARQPYNSKLVDGDMFYVVNENELQNLVMEYYNNNLRGKTFRAGLYDDDDIFQFNDFGSVEINKLFSPTQSIFNSLKTKEDYLKTKNGKTFKGYYKFFIPYFYFEGLEFNIIDSRVFYMGQTPKGEPNYDFFKLLPKNQIEIFKKMFEDNLSVKNIPDEYFEIRQIKREKTDF